MAEKRALPFVSVIVPVLDDLPGLNRCLAALIRQDYPTHLMEVIAVDNGSSVDLRPALPADPRFHLLREEGPGSYAARNRGLACAKGDVIAFTDADCSPEPAWLTQGVAALIGPPGADMVGGAVQLYFRSARPRGLAEAFEDREAFPQAGYVAQGWAVTANMFTWRRSFDRVGTFDGTLRSRGDADWGQRLTRTGGVIRFAPEAAVLHPARGEMRELLVKSRRTGRGKCDQQARQGGSRRNILGLAAHQLRLAVKKLVGGWREPAPRSSGSRVAYLAAYTIVRLAVAGEMVNYAVRMPSRDYRSSRPTRGPRGASSDVDLDIDTHLRG
ncbi:MAG: glycosyltransferase [Actinomycetota bacterium]|nr:glycosyltransferase [Actinomycetota bacterium]